jgi:single-strand DNA-binding protein
MYNQLTAFGRLTRDPELRYVTGKEGQVAVCDITIACDDRSRSGETKTGFFDFVFWAGAAEAIAKHLVKGDPILAIGSGRTETWITAANTPEPGQKRSRLKFRGREFKFCPRVATRASAPEGTEIAPTTQVGEARRQTPYQPPPPSGFTPDDDIPF